MKLLIAGPRSMTDYELVKAMANDIKSYYQIEEVVSGACDTGVHTFTREDGTKVYGVDGLGEKWAFENGIPVKPFPADWKTHGKSAGPIRNSVMANYLEPNKDGALVFTEKESRGSADMAKKVKSREVIYKIVTHVLTA